MPSIPPPNKLSQLIDEKNIWFGSVRPDGRPHLAPVWFVFYNEKFYMGIDPKSVKANNIKQNPQVVLALEDGSHPLICEGTAKGIQIPLPTALSGAFLAKYDWDLNKEDQYHLVVEITPQKWLSW